MSNSFSPVEPHDDDFVPIMDDIWFITGSVKIMPLFRMPRNMAIVRHEGDLILINPVRLNEEGLAKLDALGKVTHLLEIGGHGMDDAFYVDRYGAELWSADGRDGSTTISEETALPIPDARVFLFKDTKRPEAALLIEREGGLLLTCDSVQHWVPHRFVSPVAKIATKFIGFQNPAQIGPPWIKVQTPPGGSLKPEFERLLQLPFDKLLGAHGGLLETGAPAALRATVQREFG